MGVSDVYIGCGAFHVHNSVSTLLLLNFVEQANVTDMDRKMEVRHNS